MGTYAKKEGMEFMKKSLMKNNLKTITKTRRRFLSILVMAFLGVGFYAGLVATSPDILDSLDTYLDESKLFDIQVVSSLGLTKEDVTAIQDVEGVENAYGIQTKDSLVKLDGKESVCKVIVYSEDVNKPTLLAGTLPENAEECLLDEGYFLSNNYEEFLGKTVLLENDDKNLDGTSAFSKKELKIVGIVASPNYISNERGNTSIGGGNISFYLYAKEDAINMDYYTQVAVIVEGARQEVTNSEAYLKAVEPVFQRIEGIKQERETKRYNQLVESTKKQLQFSDNEQMEKLEMPKWYIQDRMDNTGYSNIFDAIKTMSNIAQIFPVVFYLVAVLISLTSMTRMIEEERIEIGTLKSLGYTNPQIVFKYVIYAFLACVIGGIFGMSIGFYLLPNIVWKLYSTLYTIPNFYATYRMKIGIMGILLAFICIGGATIFVAYKELKQMPAVLMRPKPPKNGKRILLEKVTVLWKRLNFSQKVTMRNIFRYKKRAIMTIVGIAGCTGLMLTGFGIKDSIVDIPNSQYGNIFKYEASVSLQNTNELEKIENYLSENENVDGYANVGAATGKLEKQDVSYDVTIFVPEDEAEFEKVCNLTSFQTNQKIVLPKDGVVITDKVAELLNVKIGDEVTLVDTDNVEHTFKVEQIAQNYVMHYVYMSKAFYEANMKPYTTNMIFINTKDIDQDARSQISEELLRFDGVASVSILSSMIEKIQNMLSTIDYVVIILIVASALLAFVVLYNLANINIGERRREIATLKVLGFYDKEVDNYINKENVIFTMIGVVLGLVFGVFFTNAIVASVEIDKLRFIRKIAPLSYVYAATITVLFSGFVNWIIHFVLKKINMIQSLKSVE